MCGHQFLFNEDNDLKVKYLHFEMNIRLALKKPALFQIAVYDGTRGIASPQYRVKSRLFLIASN
jgi:hypothetical protein